MSVGVNTDQRKPLGKGRLGNTHTPVIASPSEWKPSNSPAGGNPIPLVHPTPPHPPPSRAYHF